MRKVLLRNVGVVKYWMDPMRIVRMRVAANFFLHSGHSVARRIKKKKNLVRSDAEVRVRLVLHGDVVQALAELTLRMTCANAHSTYIGDEGHHVTPIWRR